MPRYNVQHPTNKNKWRAFSTIVDDYVTEWMDLKDYEKWRQKEYGKNCGPVYKANLMTFEDAEKTILRERLAEDFDYDMTVDEFNDSDFCFYECELHEALDKANKLIKDKNKPSLVTMGEPNTEKKVELPINQEVFERIATEMVAKMGELGELPIIINIDTNGKGT